VRRNKAKANRAGLKRQRGDRDIIMSKLLNRLYANGEVRTERRRLDVMIFGSPFLSLISTLIGGPSILLAQKSRQALRLESVIHRPYRGGMKSASR